LVAVVALTACGGKNDDAGRKRAEKRAEKRAPAVSAERAGRGLSVGITEPNANFVYRPGSKEVPEPFAHWAAELDKMRPSFYRLVVDWPALQPQEGQPPNFEVPDRGCMRDQPPCAPYAGLREQLRALATQQKRSGWQAFVVVTGTPDWAARGPRGCERDETQPRSRPPKPEAMDAYRKLIADVLALAKDEGVELRYWSPWNEPNHPYFLSPQRASCDRSSKSLAVTPYVELARAMKQALDEAPGDQLMALGDLAGLPKRRPKVTALGEFIRDLPKDLVCATHIWSQHGYIGGPNPLPSVKRALASFDCGTPHVIWMTETGVGAAGLGRERSTGNVKRGACEKLHHALLRWYEDPQVTAAFQYTLREDNLFPVGLVKTDLSEAFPALQEWQAWGAAKRPRAQDPPPPDSCGSA
jgi:hypothetical protein